MKTYESANSSKNCQENSVCSIKSDPTNGAILKRISLFLSIQCANKSRFLIYPQLRQTSCCFH